MMIWCGDDGHAAHIDDGQIELAKNCLRIQDGFAPSDVSRFLFELKFPKNIINYDSHEESLSYKCYTSYSQEDAA